MNTYIIIGLIVALGVMLFGYIGMRNTPSEPPLPRVVINDSSLLSELPEEVRDRVVLHEGVLHISSDIQGNLELDYLITILRKRGVFSYEIHKPSDFEEKYARLTLRKAQGDNEIQQIAIDLIARAYACGASDIHLVDNGSFLHIKFRRLGMLCEDSQIEHATGQKLIRVLYDTLGQSSNAAGGFNSKERLDARIVKRDYLPAGVHSVRIHTEPIECLQAATGTLMALRLLYDNTTATGTLTERLQVLGFAYEQCSTIDKLTRRKGLILVSGPTGHGKSTVLKHIMESMTEYQPERSYLSVEDPPEYPLKGVYQIQVITKAPSGNLAVSWIQIRAESYREAIAGAMRSDPDVIMIGEIRYPEAAFAAIQVAQTGHAVWATVHASNAFGIVSRLETMLRTANVRDPLSMICDPNVLAGLEYQCLVPILCPHCKKPLRDVRNTSYERQVLPSVAMTSLENSFSYNDLVDVHVRGTGCDACQGIGFKGQTVVAETVDIDAAMLQMLRLGKTIEAINHWKNNRGGMTYQHAARQLMQHGMLDPSETISRMGVELNSDKFYETASMDDGRRFAA